MGGVKDKVGVGLYIFFSQELGKQFCSFSMNDQTRCQAKRGRVKVRRMWRKLMIDVKVSKARISLEAMKLNDFWTMYD